MNLLIDLGNTRLKIAANEPGGEPRVLGGALHRDRDMEAALAEALGCDAAAAHERALIANVAGDAAGQALAKALRARGTAVSFLRPAAEAGGVRCGYAEPARLGADRWAAMLGARALADGPCLVVDAGSALTIDAIDAGGVHLGGWIIPGLSMMVAALEARTGDLGARRRASAASGSDAFPADTGPAMEQGARLAAYGAIQAARTRLEHHGKAPVRVLLTGGDAAALLCALEGAEHVPDLVLRGLGRALDSDAS
jgi:type III pantothenate kinase